MSSPKRIVATKFAYKRPADPPMPEGTILVLKTTAKTPVYMIDNELDIKELAAIGSVTVQWAHLEHMLLVRTMQLATDAKVSLPEDANKLSFAKRLRAWRVLVQQTVKKKSERERLLSLHQRIASAEDDRHKITHGLWEYDRRNPHSLTASSFRTPFAFEKSFDLVRLVKLFQTIAAINFEMHFPKGPKSLERPSSFASREFLQAFSAIDPPSPRHLQATPPKRKAPRSTSKA